MTKNNIENEPDLEDTDAMAHPTPDPEEEMRRREQIQLIEEEILRLPTLQRECLNLKARGPR
jgi:hypothetical protein